MLSIRRDGRGVLAALVGAIAVTACGGIPPTAAPIAPVTAPPQTFAPTLPPVTPPPAVTITLPPTASTPGSSGAPAPASSAGVDPSADLKIGPPYTFEPLDPALANVFIAAMEDSLGTMSSLFQVGVKSAVENGQSAAWVIVMAFPDIPIRGDTLLDAAAQGAAGQGEVEKLEVAGQAVRIIESEGIFSVLTMIDDELVMAISGKRSDGVAVIASIIESN